MSRNIGDTWCRICYGEVALVEVPRPITKIEAGYYFDEYEGMVVAGAHCIECDAKYLAWVEHSKWPWLRRSDQPFADLSFRRAFNDEPAAEDLPTKERLQTIHERECFARAKELEEEAEKLYERAIQERDRGATDTSHWESYRR